MTREQPRPTTKDEIPIQAEASWNVGFSQTFPTLPIRCRKEIAVNMMKKMNESASEIAKNTGAAAGGAARMALGVLGVNTDVSKTGVNEGEVQVNSAVLLGFEQDPNIPTSILGPSTAWVDPGCVRAEDGVTVRSET